MTFLQVIAIISLILIDLTIIYFNDFGTDTVEEVTVVRHHEQTEVCAAQVIFQPFSHIKIEMVGRLIQNQQVRLSDKGIGKRLNVLQLSTRKMLYLLDLVFYLQLSEQHKIFNKFDRVASGSRKTGASGFGLGLNYVLQVVSAHWWYGEGRKSNT